MRVLLVGEGPHDIGQREWSVREKAYVDLPGWLHTAIEKLRISGQEVVIEALRKSELVLIGRQRRAMMPLPKGHGERALAAAFRAASGKYDVVVFMTDADTREAAIWKQHHDDIADGFRRGPRGPAAVVCLPKSASESWILADPNAWRALGIADLSVLPSKPEDIWGDRHDPASHHPKHAFERAARNADLSGDGRGQRVAVMEASDPITVAAACPVSFLSFWREFASTGLGRPTPPVA